MNDDEQSLTIVMHPVLVPAFEAWLASRHLQLAGPVRMDDDDFYVISPRDDHPGWRDA